MNAPRQACPVCGNPVDVLCSSPRPTKARPVAHIVAVYPCGCWISPQAARAVKARHDADRAAWDARTVAAPEVLAA